MVKTHAPACLALVMLGCDPQVQSFGDRRHSSGGDQATSSVAAAEPAVNAPAQPAHADATPWAFPAGEAVTGRGPCVGVTLASLLDEIRREFPELRHIHEFRALGPRGAPLNAGPATPAAEPPPVPMEKASHVLGLMDDRSFGAVFFSGERCRGDRCEDRQYWYFETGAECRPRWVGHHHAIDKAGGRHGTCVEVTGSALWGLPGNPPPRQRCDADWSPQDISGTHTAFSLDGLGNCSTIPGNVIPVDLTVAQDRDRSKATVTLHGTGIPFVDGRAFSGNVERQAFTASFSESTSGACPVRREIDILLDFEAGPSINAIPGGFGLVDIAEQPLGPCPEGPKACSASLHLIRRP